MWAAGHQVVVGIDEVGRGAWAGPLMVGAAVLPREKRVLGVRDSKMLSEANREKPVRPHRRVVRRVGCRGAPARRNATRSAWRQRSGWQPSRALATLREQGVEPDVAVVDGKWDFVTPWVPHVEMRVKADRICLSVAAASILAKVTRDRIMRDAAQHYPQWSFDTNKGYPCPVHKAALQGYGPCVIHRRTWVFMDHYVPWPGVLRVQPPPCPGRAAGPVLRMPFWVDGSVGT